MAYQNQTFGSTAVQAQPVARPAVQPHPQPLGTQVNGWVDHSAAQIPGLNPGAGGPIHGQQVPNTQFPLNPTATPPIEAPHPPIGVPDPGAAPPIPAAPGAAPPAALPPTPATLGGPMQHWQDRINAMATSNPERYARLLPMLQQLMQRRGVQLPQGFQVPSPQPLVQPAAVNPNAGRVAGAFVR